MKLNSLDSKRSCLCLSRPPSFENIINELKISKMNLEIIYDIIIIKNHIILIRSVINFMTRLHVNIHNLKAVIILMW